MQDEQKKEREVSVASDVTVLEMANVTPQSVACCRSPLAQPPLAPDNVESEAGSPLEPLTEFMASLQFRDPKSASDDVKEFGFGYIDDLELTDNSDIKAMFEYVTDRTRPGHQQWTPLQQGRFLRQVTALKEKLKAGWQAIPNCILAKHTHTHTHTHTHNSMQDEQEKEREVSVASYVTVLKMANITPQVKVAVLKVLIEHETDESVKAVVAPALQGDLDVTALKEKLKAGWHMHTSRIEAAGDKRSAAQNKRTRTTRQATQTQPFQLAASLEKIPAEDWCRSWPAGRTIMLRSTSKRIKDVVDKMLLPAVVRLSLRFWDDARNGTDKEKRHFVLRQVALMTAPHHHTRSGQLCNGRTTCRVPCRRSAGAVPSAGVP